MAPYCVAERFMITGGDANLRDPPQFGFAFQFSAEVFFVRVDLVVRPFSILASRWRYRLD